MPKISITFLALVLLSVAFLAEGKSERNSYSYQNHVVYGRNILSPGGNGIQGRAIAGHQQGRKLPEQLVSKPLGPILTGSLRVARPAIPAQQSYWARLTKNKDFPAGIPPK
ncbi:OLC1v1006754C1 [Oldenlandia corymbosa var. corymbosa]|uniref:OLC1v1006754C1 n=1 Tax=Oldenlandia corymbosa var. corymbosa TaxID=529605 RepID=A0AAV1DHT5_OLDCO|nr:OLC1v1006754C1 [Oldenlandia corymbosa var. corymbosa]